MNRSLALILLAVVVAAGCAGSDDGTSSGGSGGTSGAAAGDEATEPATAGATSERYADLELWHCHPDAIDDVCDRADLAVTVIAADGSTTVVEGAVADDPPVDCFYVYPTVALDAEPGVQSFDEPVNPLEAVVTASTFARFGEVCRLFAPRYEQMTIGGYRSDSFEEHFSVGDAQIEEAFDHYLATENDGRPFVVVGHSQGSHHLTRLLQERFDGDGDADEALRTQLLSALLIGPTGWVYAPPGETTGGTFERLELCTATDQLGCVVAYDSYDESSPPSGSGGSPTPDGMARACTNPADLGAGDAGGLLAGPHFAASTAGITTATEVWPDYYTATCATDAGGQPYLEIAATPGPSDQRTGGPLVGYPDPTLHRLDPNLGMRDLVDLVAAQAAAHAADG